jgi:hypothetical protein
VFHPPYPQRCGCQLIWEVIGAYLINGLVHWWIHNWMEYWKVVETVGGKGLIGGCRSLRVVVLLKGLSSPQPSPLSLCLLAAVNWVAFATHNCLHDVSFHIRPKAMESAMDWNLWNCEPKLILSPLSSFARYLSQKRKTDKHRIFICRPGWPQTVILLPQPPEGLVPPHLATGTC